MSAKAGSDPFDDPAFKRYAKRCRDELEPMMKDSAVCMSILPSLEHVDVKFATELGFMIMLDKPIIAIVQANSKVPSKLVLIADEIVEGDLDDPSMKARLMEAMDRVTERLKEQDDQPEG